MLASSALAAAITRAASTQTYMTIRLLVDKPLIADAFRAYAYFRWVDDMVDQGELDAAGRVAFLARQQHIMQRCSRGDRPGNLRPQEMLVADLLSGEQTGNSGLHTYLNQMMAVMIFDARRRGRLISQAELTAYTRHLATAVTEAMHHFIGHGQAAPRDETRYAAVTGAHMTHMLRDAVEDTAAGYINIPAEYLAANKITPGDLDQEAYQAWVQHRVALARDCLATGRAYIERVENLRCRLAGFAYIARFEIVLDAIEKDDYRLRAAYPELKSAQAALKLGRTALSRTAHSSSRRPAAGRLPRPSPAEVRR